MRAFDELSKTARQALAQSYFNWAVQPFYRDVKNGKSGHAIARSIKMSDLKKLTDEGAILMEYAVVGEDHEGNVCTIKDGFTKASHAEDYPVRLSDWKRVWVMPVDAPKPAAALKPEAPSLPPKPWDWVAAGTPQANGKFQAYLVDATGRKIAAIWGRSGEKELIADHILDRCNA
jgi:hypothetical protein